MIKARTLHERLYKEEEERQVREAEEEQARIEHEKRRKEEAKVAAYKKNWLPSLFPEDEDKSK